MNKKHIGSSFEDWCEEEGLDFDLQAGGCALPQCAKCVGDYYKHPYAADLQHTCEKPTTPKQIEEKWNKFVELDIGTRSAIEVLQEPPKLNFRYLTGKDEVIASGNGVTITAAGITDEARKMLNTGAATLPAGFTLGKEIEPGVVSPEFQEKLSCLRYSQFGLYEPSVADPMDAWLMSLRPTTFLERCWVGWKLWQDGISKYPWPVRENKEFRK